MIRLPRLASSCEPLRADVAAEPASPFARIPEDSDGPARWAERHVLNEPGVVAISGSPAMSASSEARPWPSMDWLTQLKMTTTHTPLASAGYATRR